MLTSQIEMMCWTSGVTYENDHNRKLSPKYWLLHAHAHTGLCVPRSSPVHWVSAVMGPATCYFLTLSLYPGAETKLLVNREGRREGTYKVKEYDLVWKVKLKQERFYCLIFFKIGSPFVVQARLKLKVLLHQLLQCLNYRYIPPHSNSRGGLMPQGEWESLWLEAKDLWSSVCSTEFKAVNSSEILSLFSS